MAADTVDLLYLFNQASHSLNVEMTAALAVLGISVRDHCVLAKAAEAPRTQKEIADLAMLDKTTMVVTVDGLEHAGLVRRVPSAEDRRARIVEPTAKGRKMAERSITIIDGLFREVIASVPAAQRQPFLDALTGLVGSRLAEPPHVPNPPRRPRQARSSN